MHRKDKLNVVLFALTGFGNTVLKALMMDFRVDVKAVFTVKYNRPFPYYPEQQLIELCNHRGINCYDGIDTGSEEGIGLLRNHSPSLIIVATFKQILTKDVLDLPELGVVNLHPSLLPRYRGPCPTQAALLNDEEYAGITIHYITEKLDGGDILIQRAVPIGKIENDGHLRHELAELSGDMIPELIGMFAGHARPDGTPQNHNLATYAPRPKVEDAILIPAADSIDMIRRKMRAYNPLPGTNILVKDRQVAVDGCELYQDSRVDGLYETDSHIVVIKNSRAIKLHKKKADHSGD